MITGNDLGIRRRQVFEKLETTRELKLSRGNPETVIELSREAYQLAKGLHSPWPEVTAYRLAQLLFRKAGKSLEDYHEIDELLKEAAGNTPHSVSPLGPLPWVYRMACLHRLSIEDPENQAGYQSDLEKTRTAAIRGFAPRRTFESGADLEHVLGCAQIQTDQFNLIELATYFVDLPYDDLVGRGSSVDSGFPLTGGWLLVTNEFQTGTAKYTREFAEAEVNNLFKKKPGAIAFSLARKDESGIWLGKGEPLREPAGKNQLLLLASVLFRNDPELSDLKRHLGCSNENLRQLKKRLLAELNGRMERTVASFWRGSFRFTSKVPIFGAVNSSVLRGL
jgi:hypothetical protein